MKPCFSGHLLDVTVVSWSCSRVNYWLPDIPCLVAGATWISRPIHYLSFLLCFRWLRVYLGSGKMLCVWTQKYTRRGGDFPRLWASNRRIISSAGHPCILAHRMQIQALLLGLHRRLKKPTIPICSLPHLVRARLQPRLGRCHNDFEVLIFRAHSLYLQNLTLTTPRASRSAHSGGVLSL
jgi:hypothetical protein